MLKRMIPVLLVFALLIMAGMMTTAMLTGCTATTGGGTATTKSVDEAALKQKAKEDSLAKEKYDREFAIAFSTGHEHHKNKNYADAIRPLLKAADLDTAKRYPQIFTELADAYLKLEKPDSSLLIYQ
ncbi:MAG: hypothetical protein EHM72_11565, partial [Calditrichaeota bacterium]